MLSDFGALTRAEELLVVVAALALAVAAFLIGHHFARKGLAWKESLGLVFACAVAALMVGGIAVERGRGPTCEDDLSRCLPPPAEVRDWDAWWRGWTDAWTIMIEAGTLGAPAGIWLAQPRRSRQGRQMDLFKKL